jgi:NAD(P)-dependent dehydrogenase (short-subunit alcohol dehydrogenase family)
MASMTLDFNDRHVVVTGGTGALGTAVVGALLAGGATCHIPYFIEEEEKNFAHRDHPRVKLISGGNIASQTVVTRIYDGVPKLWASIHLAGGFAARPVAETGEAELLSMLRTNFITCFLCCAETVRTIRRAGGGGGRIVNIAARPALEPRLGAGAAAYAASKAGVAALTQALAAEVLAEGIFVNAVAPSIIDTPANRNAMPKAVFSLWPKADEVAEVILRLASPENRITSGAVIPVYGRA